MISIVRKEILVPSSNDPVEISTGNSTDDLNCIKLIDSLYFNHNVSIVVPGYPKIPECLIKELKVDCEYYKVMLPVSVFIEKEFIDLFVKKGKLYALSLGKFDTDNCVCVTTNGFLILSLLKETYHRLGIKGHIHKNSEKYDVIIDLIKDGFEPGKKEYERIKKCLTEFLPFQFRFLLAWDVPEESISTDLLNKNKTQFKDNAYVCPSSIALYFHTKGYSVRLCEPHFSYMVDTNVLVPSFEDTEQEDLIDWLGAFSFEIFRKKSAISDSTVHLSHYEPPSNCNEVSQAVLFKWTGFYTCDKIKRLFSKLISFFGDMNSSNVPWISLNVIGFFDSPVQWKINRKDVLHPVHFNSHINNYTIFINPQKSYITFKIKASE